MPVALVHGNPETAAIWGPLCAELAARGVDEPVRLSPPGFGAPVPEGWPATREAYRDWLVRELEALGGEVDLVGHDWGAGHVYGLLAVRPDLVRTWAADCAGLVHPDYVWHDAAQAWQTPGVGEEMIAGMVEAPLDDKRELFAGLGIDEPIASDLAVGADAAMGACILTLYRSAAQPVMADLGRSLAAASLPPGLAIVATADTYAGSPETATEVAASVGAGVCTLDGLGHWWMIDDPAAAADALVAHWS